MGGLTPSPAVSQRLQTHAPFAGVCVRALEMQPRTAVCVCVCVCVYVCHDGKARMCACVWSHLLPLHHVHDALPLAAAAGAVRGPDVDGVALKHRRPVLSQAGNLLGMQAAEAGHVRAGLKQLR